VVLSATIVLLDGRFGYNLEKKPREILFLGQEVAQEQYHGCLGGKDGGLWVSVRSCKHSRSLEFQA
jgi:hypothetical protein